MRARDYFCGAGGASRGLEDAGYDVEGFDVWPIAVETHNANGITAVVHDLSDPAGDSAFDDPVDLAWFSTPCQPFSAAGDGDGEFDERDGFPWALRILARTLPPVALFENVKGLTFEKHRPYLSGILASIRALGYELEHKVLNTADYGVPQTRERFIIVARRDGGVISWPQVTHTEHPGLFTAPWVTMAEALQRPEWMGWKYNRGEGMEERHGQRRAHPFTEPAPAITGNAYKDYKVVALDQWVHTRPATTIAGDDRVFQPGGHHQPGEQSQNAIRVSINELATLQGFPAGWVWCGNKTEQARQIGNAVPPRLAEVVASVNRPVLALVA